MPVTSLKSSPRAKVFIPTDSDTYVKIEIIDDDDITYTVADSYGGSVDNNFTISATIKKSSTSNLGSFDLKLINDGGRWLNKFDGGEIIKVYADNIDATTLIFYGKVDSVKYGVNLSDGFYVNINGRDYPELIDKTITGIEAASRSDISLAKILYNNYSDITLSYWNGSEWIYATYMPVTESVSWSSDATNYPTTLINMSYQHKKGYSTITEICERAGLDCYLEWIVGTGWVLRVSNIETKENIDSSISYGLNLLSLNEFGIENDDIYNRIIVYGKIESDNVLLMKSEDDTSSQSNLWIKDKIINASDLTTMDEVQDRADYELSVGTNIDNNGSMTSICLPSIRPGEMINISVPYCNINGLYSVKSYTHTFSKDSIFKTSVELVRKRKQLKDILVTKVNAEEFISSIDNPNSMKDSYTIYFNESPSKVTLTNCEINDGVVYLSEGETSGSVTSNLIDADYNVTSCELRRYENYETAQDTYEVTNDGINWETYIATEGNIHTFSTSGSRIGFRLNLVRTNADDSSPAYEAIAMLIR